MDLNKNKNLQELLAKDAAKNFSMLDAGLEKIVAKFPSRAAGGKNWAAFYLAAATLLCLSGLWAYNVWTRGENPDDSRHPYAARNEKSKELGNLKFKNEGVDVEGIGESWLVVDTYLYACALSPDGRHLLTSEEGALLRVWDLKEKKELRSWKVKGPANVTGLFFQMEGKYICAKGTDGKNHTYEFESGNPVEAIACEADKEHADLQKYKSQIGGVQVIYDLAFDAKTRDLLVATPNGIFNFGKNGYKGQSMQDQWGRKVEIPLRKNFLWKTTLSMNSGLAIEDIHDQQFEGQKFRVRDIKSGKIKYTTEDYFIGDFCISPDGQYALTAGIGMTNFFRGEDSFFRLWDLDTGKVLKKVEAKACGVAFAPDSLRFVAIKDSSLFRIYDTKSLALKSQVLIENDRPGGIGLERFPPIFVNQNQVLAVYGNSPVLFDLEKYDKGEFSAFMETFPSEFEGVINCMALSPDSLKLACGDEDRRICVYDVKEKKVTQRFVNRCCDNESSCGSKPVKMVFNSDGSILAVANANGTICLYHLDK